MMKSSNPNKVNRSQQYHYKRWLFKAVFGLLLIGFGTCLVAEATMLKHHLTDNSGWVLYGTIALVVLNSGVCFVGDAVKHRVFFERGRSE